MNLKKEHLVRRMLGAGAILALLAVALFPMVTMAQSADPPPRPTSVFPPRPTPVPTSVHPPEPAPEPETESKRSRPPEGGYIELEIHPVQMEVWTVVQWQDNYGHWHDVEGWQGTPDQNKKTVLWWVAKKDLGTGLFRWVVYECRGCWAVATSEPFYLPESIGQRLVVEVSE